MAVTKVSFVSFRMAIIWVLTPCSWLQILPKDILPVSSGWILKI
jgi:hypothetical protein